jgi:hypothetical protein
VRLVEPLLQPAGALLQVVEVLFDTLEPGDEHVVLGPQLQPRSSRVRNRADGARLQPASDADQVEAGDEDLREGAREVATFRRLRL